MLTEKQVEKFLVTLKNPRWVEPGEKGPVLFDGEINGGKVLFFASSIDGMDYGREIYQKAINGDYGKITPFDEAAKAALDPNLFEQPDPVPDLEPDQDLVSSQQKG